MCDEVDDYKEPFVNRLMIERVDNGYMVRDSDNKVTVFEVSDAPYDDEGNEEVETMRKLLYFIVENYNINNSRYAKHSVVINNEPADKYESPEKEEPVDNTVSSWPESDPWPEEKK